MIWCAGNEPKAYSEFGPALLQQQQHPEHKPPQAAVLANTVAN